MQGLHHCIVDRCDREDLETPCFELGVNFDALSDEDKVDEAWEQIICLERCERIPDLPETGQQKRSDITTWADLQLDLAMDQPHARRAQVRRNAVDRRLTGVAHITQSALWGNLSPITELS